MCVEDRGRKSKKEKLLTCNSSACPSPSPLLYCLVRRFINRANRGRPDGCYDTVISFHGSPSRAWALVCCLLAACRSFPCNTHSCKGEVFSPDTQMVFTHPLSYQQLGPSRPRSVSEWVLEFVFVCLCVCVCVYRSALVFCCLTL